MAMATLLGQFEILSIDTPDGGEARERLSFTMAPVGLRMRLQAQGAGARGAEERRFAAQH